MSLAQNTSKKAENACDKWKSRPIGQNEFEFPIFGKLSESYSRE